MKSIIDSGSEVSHFRSYLKIEEDGKEEVIEFDSINPNFAFNRAIDNIQVIDGAQFQPLERITVYRDVLDRLKQYLNIGMTRTREEINPKNRYGSYCFNIYAFDCRRFASYLQTGKENTDYESASEGQRISREIEFPSSSLLASGMVYKMTAISDTFGKARTYKQEDIKLHFFVYLGEGVFISKFGKAGIFFTPYSSLLESYWPKSFPECWLKVL